MPLKLPVRKLMKYKFPSNKVIVKQARTFGLRASYGDVGSMHLRDLA